jgi:hypothetical protein
MVPYCTSTKTPGKYSDIYQDGTVCYTGGFIEDDEDTFIMNSYGPGEPPKKEKFYQGDEFQEKLRKKEWRREQFKT